ncbi:MAG: hypothetical protein WCF57_04550 [Pyrinomonadaceae bacterium]
MKKTVLFVVALLVSILFVAASASAQTREQPEAPASAQDAARSDSAESADLSITANVTARELRFELVPNPQVEFTGSHERKTEWEAERENLPRPVQPGVTYRDIGIRLKITSVFADIDRIVAEALGEVPLSDDAPQPQTPVPDAPSNPSTPAPAQTTTQPERGAPR